MKSETLCLKTTINKLDFLRKTVTEWNAWKKDLLSLGNNLVEKIPDPRDAKEHYQLFIRNKNTKSVKQ